MARFEIANPGTIIGESTRALKARIWRQERSKGQGNWFLPIEDAARLKWILGGKESRKVLRSFGFDLEPDYSWRTFEGESEPLRLVINPKTWALLYCIARTFPRAIHPLSSVITAESTLRFVEA